eukprot:5894142-Pleurochrysis_carterae.AAC.1
MLKIVIASCLLSLLAGRVATRRRSRTLTARSCCSTTRIAAALRASYPTYPRCTPHSRVVPCGSELRAGRWRATVVRRTRRASSECSVLPPQLLTYCEALASKGKGRGRHAGSWAIASTER